MHLTTKIQPSLHKLGLISLVTAAFFAPLSITGTKISLILAIVCSVFSGEFRKHFSEVKTHPLVISIVMLFGFALLSTLWSTVPWSDRLTALHKYDKLLYFIFLLPLCFEQKWRNAAINAFLLAMVLTVTLSFFKAYLGLRFGVAPMDPSRIFNSHVETSFFVAFSAYVFIYRAIFSARFAGWYSFLFLLFTWQEFFINQGRTGWTVYFALLVLLVVQVVVSKAKKSGELSALGLGLRILAGVFIGSLMAVGLAFLLYMFSGNVQKIAGYSIDKYAPSEQSINSDSETKRPVHGRQKSIDLRVGYAMVSIDSIKDHPFIGTGISSFKKMYAERGTWVRKKVPGHPHNEYLLSAVQFGLVGLFLLLYFFYVQWRLTFRGIEGWPMAQALVLSFMVGCLYNAFLYTTVTGHFYVLFMALCFAAPKEQKR